jgi:fatty acid desaturase
MAGKSNHYWKSVADLKLRLRAAVPHDELQQLHRRDAWKHLLYAGRQFGLVAACSVALWHITNPLVWIPIAVLQGFTFFNMTVLLHDAVHHSIFQKRREGWNRALGLAYAITSGISASQFTRWHLDHHDNLGSSEDDPKRHWLSPKRNARWYKLLYCTFVLIPLYFRAAASEAASYPVELKRRIMRERLTTMAVQLSVMAALFYFGGAGWNSPAVRVQIFPYFVIFPIAFTMNRLGQHYNIDPTNPLKWSTLMKASHFWDFLFVYSNYHLEHHYFPSVPFYNLRKLHMRLRPLYAELGLVPHTYREIVWEWFVKNRAPHTNWALADGPAGPARPQPVEEPEPLRRVAAR